MSRFGLILLALGLAVAGWLFAGSGQRSAADADENHGVWHRTTSPSKPRTQHAAVRLDSDRVLVAGGTISEQGRRDVELYTPQLGRTTEPEGSWDTAAAMNFGRQQFELVKLRDGRVFAISGGRTDDVSAEVYDPDTNEWQAVSPAPGLSTVVSATLLGGSRCDATDAPGWCGKVLVTGQRSLAAGAALYDPDQGPSGAWSPAATPSELYNHSTPVQLDGAPCEQDAPAWCGQVLAAQGDTTEVYDPATDAWNDTGALNTSRDFHTLTPLRDGRVLAAGGEDSGERLATAEVYTPAKDPSEGTWETTAQLPGKRSAHKAARLADGTVLLAGGYDESGEESASAVLFQPADEEAGRAARFVPAGDMTVEREFHTVTALADGRALVVGGEHEADSSAEVYTPPSLAPSPQPPEIQEVRPAAGVTDGGTRVRIFGSNFGGVSRVTFGGEPAPDEEIELVNHTELRVEAPPGEAGTVPIQVRTTANGQDYTSSADNPKAAFVYVPQPGVWTDVGASLPGTPGGGGLRAVTLEGGDALVTYRDIGGNTRATRYDPDTGKLLNTADPPVRPNVMAALPSGGAVVVGPGAAYGESPGAAAVYDPEDDAWRQTQTPPPFGPRPFKGTATRLADGRVLVVVELPENIHSQVYDPDSDAWRSTRDQPEQQALWGAPATRLADGRVLLAGGGGGGNEFSFSDKAQLFDPDSEQWTVTGSLHRPRGKHAATRLVDGRVLLTGGESIASGEGFTAGERSSEAYNPAEEAWESMPSMAQARWYHTLTPLADGSVLAVGGSDLQSDPLAHAELLRPDSLQWEPAGRLAQARTKHAAAYLGTDCGTRCGSVVAFGGGTTGDGGETASVELYTPGPQVTAVEPARGVPGTEVTIRGYGFAGADEVTIGGTSVDFTITRTPGTPEAPAEITATVPPGLSVGEAPVTVTNEVPKVSEPLVSPASPQAVFTVVDPDAGENGGGPDGEETETGGEDDEPTETAEEEAQSAVPGLVDDLAAEPLSASEVRLTWTAVGDGSGASAPGYVVKQSREPIASEADFEDAFALCGGVCQPDPVPTVGGDLSLTVLDLDPVTTYHYAVRARNASGELGPVSDSVNVTTPGGTGGADSGDGTSSDGAESDGSELIQAVCGEDTPTASFADREAIPEAHRLAVDCAAAQGVVAGFTDGSFRPQLGLRRDQMASFIARALQAADVALPEPGEQRFADVAGDSAHAEAIHRLAAAGIVSGGPGELSADRYGLARVIRRDQMASFLIRAGEYATGQQLASGGGGRFSDVPAGNVHAAQVDAAAALELAQGYPDGTYRPGQQVRRDQMATFVTRLLGSLNQGTLADSDQ